MPVSLAIPFIPLYLKPDSIANRKSSAAFSTVLHAAWMIGDCAKSQNAPSANGASSITASTSSLTTGRCHLPKNTASRLALTYLRQKHQRNPARATARGVVIRTCIDLLKDAHYYLRLRLSAAIAPAPAPSPPRIALSLRKNSKAFYNACPPLLDEG